MFRRVSVVAAALFAGLLLGALKWRGSYEVAHREARLAAILDQAEQMQPGGVLVIGDSITERMRFERLCGLPALNAGIGWSRSADWRPDVRRVIAAAKPSIVVLSLGANDPEGTDPNYAAIAHLAAVKVRSDQFPRTETTDGKHLNAAGRAEWFRRVEAGCAQLKNNMG